MLRRAGVLLVVLLTLAACSKSANNYGKGTEAAFLETCTVHQQQPGPICSCIYTEITQRIPFDRYVELDKSMQKDDKFVPDELVSIAADCASQLTTTTTTTTSTTVVPPTSSSAASSSFSSTPPIGF